MSIDGLFGGVGYASSLGWTQLPKANRPFHPLIPQIRWDSLTCWCPFTLPDVFVSVPGFISGSFPGQVSEFGEAIRASVCPAGIPAIEWFTAIRLSGYQVKAECLAPGNLRSWDPQIHEALLIQQTRTNNRTAFSEFGVNKFVLLPEANRLAIGNKVSSGTCGLSSVFLPEKGMKIPGFTLRHGDNLDIFCHSA